MPCKYKSGKKIRWDIIHGMMNEQADLDMWSVRCKVNSKYKEFQKSKSEPNNRTSKNIFENDVYRGINNNDNISNNYSQPPPSQ